MFLEYVCSVLIGYIPLNGRNICVLGHKHQSLKNSRLAPTKEGFRCKCKETTLKFGKHILPWAVTLWISNFPIAPASLIYASFSFLLNAQMFSFFSHCFEIWRFATSTKLSSLWISGSWTDLKLILIWL